MISVVIPVMNRESELVAAIESVQRQTDGDWELLIVDDGSTDASLMVARGMQSTDSRIRSLVHPHRMNLGPGASRNLGVEAARGEYVAFLDSDDVLERSALATFQSTFEKFPAAAAVYGKARVSGIREDGSTVGFGIPDEPADLFRQLVHNNVFATGSMACRREVLDSHPFPSEMPSSQDWACWLKLSVYQPFFFVDEYLLQINATDSSITGAGLTDQRTRSRYCRIQANFLRQLLASIQPGLRPIVIEGLRWRGAECLLRALFSGRRGRFAESCWWAWTWLLIERGPVEMIASAGVAARTLARFRRGAPSPNYIESWTAFRSNMARGCRDRISSHSERGTLPDISNIENSGKDGR